MITLIKFLIKKRVFHFFLIAMICLILYNPLKLMIYRSSPQLAIEGFWNSLHQNNAFLGKGVVDIQHRNFIDEWMHNHTPTICGGLVEGPTSTGIYLNERTWRGSMSLYCSTEIGNQYCFAIRNVVVEKTKKGWLVIKWDKIREGHTVEECLE